MHRKMKAGQKVVAREIGSFEYQVQMGAMGVRETATLGKWTQDGEKEETPVSCSRQAGWFYFTF